MRFRKTALSIAAATLCAVAPSSARGHHDNNMPPPPSYGYTRVMPIVSVQNIQPNIAQSALGTPVFAGIRGTASTEELQRAFDMPDRFIIIMTNGANFLDLSRCSHFPMNTTIVSHGATSEVVVEPDTGNAAASSEATRQMMGSGCFIADKDFSRILSTQYIP